MMLPYNDGDEDGEVKRKSVATDDEFETFDTFEAPSKIAEKSPTNDSENEPAYKKTKIEKAAAATRLVSYGADDYDENDGERDSNADPLDFNHTDNDSDSDSIIQNDEKISKEELNRSISRSLNHSLSEEDVVIPLEPIGNCSRRLQDKVARLYEKVLRTGQDMNGMIQQRKDFRNPSIYEKLIEFCGIDEKGTNYPPELFNYSIYGAESHYEELAKAQKLDIDRREKEKKEKKEKSLTVERIQGVKKTTSKWDTVITTAASSVAASAMAAVNSSNHVQISAVGPLPKQKIIS